MVLKELGKTAKVNKNTEAFNFRLQVVNYVHRISNLLFSNKFRTFSGTESESDF